MITIDPNSNILRDGDEIGTIQKGVAYMKAKPAPRIIGQIREAAGDESLSFVVGETPISTDESTTFLGFKITETVQVDNDMKEKISSIKDLMQKEPHIQEAEQPPAQAPQAGSVAGYDLTGFPSYATDPRGFQRAFVNNYGPDAFSEWQKTNA